MRDMGLVSRFGCCSNVEARLEVRRIGWKLSKLPEAGIGSRAASVCPISAASGVDAMASWTGATSSGSLGALKSSMGTLAGSRFSQGSRYGGGGRVFIGAGGLEALNIFPTRPQEGRHVPFV